jgi:hypothetical protein
MTPLLDQSVKMFCIFLVKKIIHFVIRSKNIVRSLLRPQINSIAANFAKDMENFAKIWKTTKWGKKERKKKPLAKN